MSRSLQILMVLLSCLGFALDLEATHPLPGPHFLHCEQRGDAVTLTWDELGISESLHRATLLRDGVLLAVLAADSSRYHDIAAPSGKHTYRLEILLKDPSGGQPTLIAAVECEADLPGAQGIFCNVFGGVALPPRVAITWEHLSPNPGVVSIRIERDGDLVGKLEPTATHFEEEPLSGEHLYTVIGVVRNAEPALNLIVGSCLATFSPPIIGGLIRGDSNGDEESDISDCVLIVLYLFGGGDEPECLKSADVNDSGRIELTDAIDLAQYLFVGGAPPAAPFPDCGHDGTPDDLTCNFYAKCYTPPPP